MLVRWLSRLPLTLSGGAGFWVGTLLAASNGYPLTPARSVAGSVATLGLIGLLVSRPGIGWEIGSCLAAGFLAVLSGFYLSSGHWASELFLVGLLLTAASFLTCLSSDYAGLDQDPAAGGHNFVVRLGPVGSALLYTGMNILVIGGLVFSLWFPATPLPYHHFFWVLLAMAVVNQELIKRRCYFHPQGRKVLHCLTGAAHIFLGAVWLGISWARL